MIIRKLTKKDIPHASRIHRDILDQGVISHLGISFLEKFYWVLLKQKNITTLVAYEDDKVVGFATAACDLKSIPRLIIRQLWRKILISLIKKPFLFYRLIQMPFYPSFKQDGRIGEIFSLAVLPDYQRRGIGTELIKHCRKEFRKYQCELFQVKTLISFYKNLHS